MFSQETFFSDIWKMDFGFEFVPPLPLEPPYDEVSGSGQCKAPPPPPLQTSSDAEEMDVSSGGDGPSLAPVDDGRPREPCPGTGRHAPRLTNFLPDLKLLRDVKISVSFGADAVSKSKDRKVLYTGRENGQPYASVEQDAEPGTSGVGTVDRRSEEESEQENKVEYAVLDELDDYSENFLDTEDGEPSEYSSEMIAQQEHANEDDLGYSYEVLLTHNKRLYWQYNGVTAWTMLVSNHTSFL